MGRHWMLLLLLVVLGIAPQSALPVAGGVTANGPAWPFMVALLDASNPDPFQAQFCGGTMVRQDWVLTAAHCVTNPDGSPVPVQSVHAAVGIADLTAVAQEDRIAVDRISVYPRWRPGSQGLRSFAYDIAVLHLVRPAGTPADLPLAQLPDADRPGEAWVAGWGRESFETYPSQLRTGRVSVSTPRLCRDLVGVHGVVCGTLPASGEASSCDGDSGGPLLDLASGYPTVIGVVNFGRRGVCERGSTAAFADVGTFRTWIAYITRGIGRDGTSLPEISSVRARDLGREIRVTVTWCQDGSRGHPMRIDMFLNRGDATLRRRTVRGRATGRCMTATAFLADVLPNGRYSVVGKVIDVRTGLSFRAAPTALDVG